MSEEASKHKRKAKSEDGPDKKVKLEPSSSNFEVQPEVEVIAISSRQAAYLTSRRISSAKPYGDLCKITSGELLKVRSSLRSCKRAGNTTMIICD